MFSGAPRRSYSASKYHRDIYSRKFAVQWIARTIEAFANLRFFLASSPSRVSRPRPERKLFVVLVGAILAALPLFCSANEAFAADVGTIRAAPMPNIVYAHYMHPYILGDVVGALPADPDDLANWPTAEMNPRSWWPDSLNAVAHAGLSSEAIDLSLGQQAGIDAFALYVSPTNVQPISAYLPGMQRLAAAASTTTVKLIPDIWFSINASAACTFTNPCDAASWAAFGRNLQNLMNKSPNAFLTVGGKYLISISSALYGNDVTASGFQHFFDPWGGASKFVVIECSGPFTTQSAYTASGWPNADQAVSMWTGDAGWNDPQYTNLPLEAAYDSKPLSWPIHSSYFGFRPGVFNEKENFGVANMIQQWTNAIVKKTQFAEVQTWNDFTEDHAITQTNTRGSTLIHLTRYFSDWFTSGVQPTIAKDRIFTFYQRQWVHAKLTDATRLAAVPKLSESQMVDYLDVVSMLTAPGLLTLTDGGLEMQLDAPAGLHEWLVYAPSALSRYNYPPASASLTVNVVASIPAALPSVKLTRAGKSIATATGPAPIQATAKWQDLTMLGAESKDTNPARPY